MPNFFHMRCYVIGLSRCAQLHHIVLCIVGDIKHASIHACLLLRLTDPSRVHYPLRAVDNGDGLVSLQEFCAVCSNIGVSINMADAIAVFQRFGHDDNMPYAKWANLLMLQPNHRFADLPSNAPGCHLSRTHNFKLS